MPRGMEVALELFLCKVECPCERPIMDAPPFGAV